MGGDLWSGQGGAYQRSRRRRRGPWLVVLLLLPVLLASVVFLYPAWAEDAPGACVALERRAVQVALSEAAPPAVQAAARRISPRLLTGAYAEAVMAERYPWLPVPAGCSLAYWRLLLDGSAALAWVAGLRR